MGDAKNIIVKVIPASIGNEFIRKHHYSGKIVNNSNIHFGCFMGGVMHGAMSFGGSTDKGKLIGLVAGTGWNEFIELNRMAFDDVLPRNSESRCIAIAIKMIRKNAPHIKWIISFSDATASGDGTIYRATGFYLTAIKRNESIYVFPDGARYSRLTLTNGGDLQSRIKVAKKYNAEITSKASMKTFTDIGAIPAPGFQLRYIYLIDKTAKLTVPILPYSTIDEMGAGMYRGKTISIADRNQNKHAPEALPG